MGHKSLVRVKPIPVFVLANAVVDLGEMCKLVVGTFYSMVLSYQVCKTMSKEPLSVHIKREREREREREKHH